jgi:hypothetical protein
VQDLLPTGRPRSSRSDFSFWRRDIPHFRHLHEDLACDKPVERVLQDFASNLDRFEEWAIALFYKAMAEVHPDRLGDLPDPPWVNAWGIGLNPLAGATNCSPTRRRSLAPIRDMLS